MSAERATERLVRAREYTDESGHATAEVVSEPYAEDDRLHVPIAVLTTGERYTLTFQLPRTWETDDPVVRLVEEVGYGPGGVEMLVGERFPVDLSGDAPRPAFDVDAESAETADDESTSVRTVIRAVDTVFPVVRRRFGRTARYGAALTAFGSVVAVGALVAATVTYAVVLAGLLAVTAAGWLGGIGTAALLVGVAAAGVVGARLRSRRYGSVATASRPHGGRSELLRNR